MRFECEFKIGIFPLSNSNSQLELIPPTPTLYSNWLQAGSRFHASKPAYIKDHSSLSRYSRLRLPVSRLMPTLYSFSVFKSKSLKIPPHFIYCKWGQKVIYITARDLNPPPTRNFFNRKESKWTCQDRKSIPPTAESTKPYGAKPKPLLRKARVIGMTRCHS